MGLIIGLSGDKKANNFWVEVGEGRIMAASTRTNLEIEWVEV